MPDLFGRMYVMEIESIDKVFTIGGQIGSFNPAGTAASKKKISQTTYEDFRVSFNIVRTLGKTPDKATFEIYNVVEGKWASVDFKKNKAKLRFHCGYRQIEPDLLFSGQITNYERIPDKLDVITHFTCGDGQDALTKANINKSYNAGMDIATIMDDVIKGIKDEGIEIAGNIKDKLAGIKAESKKADTGLSISGLLSDTLEDLLTPFNKTFTIQDDVLKIVEIGQEIATTIPTLITPETGLIGSPVKTKDGLEFVSLIQPGKFNPGQFVEIISRDFDGKYKIVKSNFVGDTHGNDWYVRGLCI